MRIQYNGKSKILIRLTELVNQKADAEDMEQTAADLQKEIDEKADKSAIPTVGDGVLSVQRNGKSVGTFSANAAENEAINIPVPEKVSELENDAGYGTYTKPATGIPKSDFASGVQTSLGKADTALQKHQDISGKVDNTAAGADSLLSKITNSWTATPTDNTYFIRQDTSSKNEFGRVKFSTLWSYIKSKVESLGYTKNTGTITGIKMNGASKGTSGVVDLGTVITAHQDISGKQDKSTAVTHSANTAAGSATKPVYVDANGVATAISHSINSDVPANAKFTDTTYNDATQSTHGLMTAADKKKLDGMDLSKYLPKSGGVMTGDIDMQTNKRDILIGTQPASAYGTFTPVSSGQITTDKKFVDLLPTMRSYMGTYNYKTASIDQWYDLISVRHRNGYGDGSGWGMMIFAPLFGGDLQWNLNTNKDKWQGFRYILDSSNFADFAAKRSHTHDMIVNNSKLIAGSNNVAQWCRLGTLTSFEDFSTTVISVWSGDGANGLAAQNSWFEIHIKDGWQSTQSTNHACGVTVYRTRCGTVKVKVIPTAHNTFTVWVYLPWGYWNGNYAVNGRYKTWTSDFKNQTAEPEGTAADTAYYDQAFLTSTVAKATEATTLTDSGWQKPTFPSGVKSSSIRYRKQGKIVSVTGYVQFSTAQTTITVFTLPTGYRPPAKIQQFNAVDSSAQASFLTKIDTDGKVGFFGKTQGFFTTATEYYMHCTFFVD